MKRMPGRHRLRTIYACAFVVSASFIGIAQTIASADARETTGDIRIQGDKTRPYLIFGCDRQTGDLDSLFTPALVSELKELGAGVALSTEDFSSARAQVVRRLSDAGIPMTAWIVLPKEQGYYVNVGNAAQTAARFAEFDAWTSGNGLRWEAVGLDIEPTLQEFGALTGDTARLLSMAIQRAFDWERVRPRTTIIRRWSAACRRADIACRLINSRSSPTNGRPIPRCCSGHLAWSTCVATRRC